ncbi:uncharacterized protein LOC108935021 [Scleropages formosus]|uniref:Zgc:113691 n=1 Tax=Scleropages formosus TaxID=113540 RepID=A0A8C9SIQ2_SCLFO|nr:uncharacterized protein LOC108935021 [Scleropages formosus]
MATSTGNVEKMSKFDTLKLLEKCRKERDDAVQRETQLREKLKQYESRLRSTEALRQKLRHVSLDNKELRRMVKSLRTDLGLESSPKFQGKTTKDIVNDLQEKEHQCSSLTEKNGKLSVRIDELASQLANTITSKAIVEEQMQSLQQNLKDMTNNQRRLLKLWEDKRVQREQLFLPSISQRPGTRPVVAHKAVQTDMSIGAAYKLPPTAFELKPYRRESERNKSTLDKLGINNSLQNGIYRDKTSLTQYEHKPLQN